MATITALQLKSDFWRHQNEHWSGTLTGGATDRATDTVLANLSSETWPTNVEGTQLRMTNGASDGDLRQVARFNRSDGVMIPDRDFSSTGPVSTNTYELWGNAIHGGQQLTNLFNDVLRRLRPVTHTAVTIVTSQAVYDITTLVPVADDVRRVYLRLLDAANLVPYTEQELAATVWNDGGAATTSVKMRIPPQTLNAAANTLHVEHFTSFTAFSTDASTVDAVYRDWLAWEFVSEFAARMIEGTTQDQAKWRVRMSRAAEQLATLRPRFLPAQEPIRGEWVRF
jgi:hypothetical protein